ncbi:MAG: hypothetical protein BACD_02378 [Bacteroides rodentium]
MRQEFKAWRIFYFAKIGGKEREKRKQKIEL